MRAWGEASWRKIVLLSLIVSKQWNYSSNWKLQWEAQWKNCTSSGWKKLTFNCSYSDSAGRIYSHWAVYMSRGTEGTNDWSERHWWQMTDICYFRTQDNEGNPPCSNGTWNSNFPGGFMPLMRPSPYPPLRECTPQQRMARSRAVTEAALAIVNHPLRDDATAVTDTTCPPRSE